MRVTYVNCGEHVPGRPFQGKMPILRGLHFAEKGWALMLFNIITLVVSLLLILVFRQLDKNNKSIDKVKKYSDKIKTDLDTYFNTRSQALQDAAVELEVKQTQAIAAVKRL